MSAFIVSKKHITSIVAYYQGLHYDTRFDGNDAVEMANRLMKKNVDSVAYRYHGEEIKELPGVIAELAANAVPEIKLNDFIYNMKPLKAVEALKAIDCLSYQSCELPDWYESEEYKFLKKVRHVAISRLPGYEDAAWDID